MKTQEELKKEARNQLKAFESYFNKRKQFIGVRAERKITKYLNKIVKELER